MSATQPALSVAIIAFNEEARIARCIEHVAGIADEIIVVDSGSTDKTGEIAESLGAKLFREEWKGFAAQRNSARDKCSGTWILFIDCDEVLSAEARSGISAAVTRNSHDGYQLKFISFFMGKWIQHSWRQDWHIRLARRDSCRWTGQYVHETLECDGAIGRVNGHVYHFTYSDYENELSKSILYAKLGAQSLCARNKKIRLTHLVFNPLWGFIKHYFVKRGFLDGFQGFVIALSNLHYTFSKYLIAWEIQNPETCKGTDIPKE